jgi:hypothetical protein
MGVANSILLSQKKAFSVFLKGLRVFMHVQISLIFRVFLKQSFTLRSACTATGEREFDFRGQYDCRFLNWQKSGLCVRAVYIDI